MKPLGHMVSEMSSMVTRLSLEAVEMVDQVEWQRRRSRFILTRDLFQYNPVDWTVVWFRFFFSILF